VIYEEQLAADPPRLWEKSSWDEQPGAGTARVFHELGGRACCMLARPSRAPIDVKGRYDRRICPIRGDHGSPLVLACPDSHGNIGLFQ
jgi:hypothetical protein